MTPFILDAACGSRMFWFDRDDPRAVFVDVRSETRRFKDSKAPGGCRHVVVRPSVQADFRMLPFRSDTFHLVVADPPHLLRAGRSSLLAAKYGVLAPSWESDLSMAFRECLRVLRPMGVLALKWSSSHIPLREVLSLLPAPPLCGDLRSRGRSGSWTLLVKDPPPGPLHLF